MEEKARGYTTGVFQVGILVSDIDECMQNGHDLHFAAVHADGTLAAVAMFR